MKPFIHYTVQYVKEINIFFKKPSGGPDEKPTYRLTYHAHTRTWQLACKLFYAARVFGHRHPVRRACGRHRVLFQIERRDGQPPVGYVDSRGDRHPDGTERACLQSLLYFDWRHFVFGADGRNYVFRLPGVFFKLSAMRLSF